MKPKTKTIKIPTHIYELAKALRLQLIAAGTNIVPEHVRKTARWKEGTSIGGTVALAVGALASAWGTETAQPKKQKVRP